MQKELNRLKEDLIRSLANSSIGYLKLGMEHFHSKKYYYEFHPQTIISNLSISIELMLKAFIAKHGLELLFDNLPLEFRAILAKPNSFKKSRLRPYEIELQSNFFSTKKLSDCIALFYILKPDHKQIFGSYFKQLILARNSSLHFYLPKYKKYNVERIAYLAISLYKLLKEESVFSFNYNFTKEDDGFITTYDSDRIIKVEKVLKMARENAKKLDYSNYTYSPHDEWQSYETDCPCCGSNALLFGDTEEDFDSEYGEPYLTFIAYSFECSECGLVLDDFFELELAGMEAAYDRTDSHDSWVRYHGYNV